MYVCWARLYVYTRVLGMCMESWACLCVHMSYMCRACPYVLWAHLCILEHMCKVYACISARPACMCARCVCSVYVTVHVHACVRVCILLPHSPRQRPAVGQVKDLVGVQQLPETGEQVPALEASTLGVHKHEEGPAARRQLGVLTGAGSGQASMARSSHTAVWVGPPHSRAHLQPGHRPQHLHGDHEGDTS